MPESLGVFAEVSAALAGFAALVGILRRDDRIGRRSAFGIVETSLIALAFSLLPFAISNLRIAAFLFFATWSAAWVNALFQYRRTAGSLPDATYAPLLFRAAALSVQLAGSLLSLLVVLRVWPEHAARVYQAAVLCPLLMSGLLLWLTIRRLVDPGDEPAA